MEVKTVDEPKTCKYSDYVHTDGRKWDELKPEEKKKLKKKLSKKDKKKPENKNPFLEQTIKFKGVEKTTTYEEELEWSIGQLKLGLTANVVTPAQCKIQINNRSRRKLKNYQNP